MQTESIYRERPRELVPLIFREMQGVQIMIEFLAEDNP